MRYFWQRWLRVILLTACVIAVILVLSAPDYVGAQDKSQNQPTSSTASAQVSKAVGTIKSIQADSITVVDKSGVEVAAKLMSSTKILHVLPGEKDLKNATALSPQDLQPGDGVRVRGWASADGHAIEALEVLVVKPTDVAAKQQHERDDWQKRGVDGIVTQVDAAADIITIKTGGMGAGRSIAVAVHIGKDTILRRYAPDSVRFEDAKPALLDQIKVGDQLNARGDRSPDGSEVNAEEVVSGTFRYIEGTIKAIDSANNTLTIQDVISKSAVVVRVSPDSQLWKLAAEMAQQIAARLKGTPGGGGGDQHSANGMAPGAASAAGAPRPASEGQAAHGAGGNGNGFQRMLSRAPSIKLADLRKGDAVVILAAADGKSDAVTASKLVAGVEAILTAAPSRSASSLLSPWSLGVSGGEGDAAQ
jgi:hypothetical protein